MIEAVIRHCDQQQGEHLEELLPVLAQPSISAQGIGVEACAILVEDLLRQSGFDARRIPTAGAPVVYAERCPHPDKPTVIIYGHYDVQPPEPLSAWITPPFVPSIRDGRIFARGVGDNKGQFVANVQGVRAWLEATGDIPINVKFVIEGEEESGSPNLPAFVEGHREMLAADLVYVADGQVMDDRQPLIEFGNRGLLFVELRASGANRDLHSGNFGGVAPNPAWTLIHLLGTMMNADYEVTIPGVHDGIRKITPCMAGALERVPLDDARILQSIGLETPAPPTGLTFAERTMTRMTCNVAGISSGYTGAGSKAVLPAEAVAKIDFRLVPDQDPRDVFEKVKAHVARHAPGVEVHLISTMNPMVVPLDIPVAKAVRQAVARGFAGLGSEPADIPLDGGSLPSSVWSDMLGIPTLLVPYANHDEAHHSPNENLVIDRYFAGIRTAAALVGELGKSGFVD